jgi:predicted dehydrogenase
MTREAWRWAVIGPGAIARSFAQDMTLVEGGMITAVASRSKDRAETFGGEFGIDKRYDSYAAVADDPDVDVAYVATPHSRHAADTLMLIEAGKHVLCEKPLALNAMQARRMADAARARGVFLMEAMWSRFLPPYRVLAEVLGEGRIGEPLLVEADFGFRKDVVADDRHFDLAQGGGALLDLGIYPVHLCTFVLGPPEGVSSRGSVGRTGVDEFVAAILQHGNDRHGVVKASIRVPLSCTARIVGTAGTIELPAFMHCPAALTVTSARGSEQIDTPWDGHGLRFEVEEVHRCLEEGLIDSMMMPLAESIAIAKTLDAIRAPLGVLYPDEDDAQR